MSGVTIYKKFRGVATQPESVATPFRPKIDTFSIVDELTDYSSISLVWTGMFTKTELYWNTTGIFNLITDSSMSFVSDVSATVTGLLAATKYYFKILSYGTTGFAKGSRTINSSTSRLPVITRINAIAIDTYTIAVSWQGAFTSVNIEWSDTTLFTNIIGTAAGVTTTPQNISGLTPNTKYFFRVLPFGLESTTGSYSSTAIARTLYDPIISKITQPQNVNGTTLLLEWSGLFNKVDIQYDISDTFMESPITYSGIKKNSYTFTDLSYSTTYYFRVLPYRTTIGGEYGMVTSITTPAFTTDVSDSYIATYTTNVDSSNITVFWDASYVSVDLHLNADGIFNDFVDTDVDNDIVVTDLSGTSSHVFSGLTPNLKYYIKITPYTSIGIVSTNQYITEYTLPYISSITSTDVTSSTASVEWDGSFDTVNVLYNTTGTFGVLDMSSINLTVSPTTIGGLMSNVKYYFKVNPYSATGTIGTSSSVINATTKPAIVSVSSEAIDSSSVSVHWSGSENTVDIEWNTTGIFDVSDNSFNIINITNIMNFPKLITGLNSTTTYYFRVRPYSSTSGYGNYSTIVSATTLYTPTISFITGNVIDNSSVVVSWDGSFATVDILWDLSGTFTSLAGSSTDVSVNEYTITRLSASTTYFVKIIPKAATYSGTPSSVISKTTLYTPVVSTLTASQIKPTSVAVNWTGTAYSAVDIAWGLTNGFTENVGSATDISNVLSYTVSGLSPSTTYYFVLTPKGTRGYGGGVYNGTKSSSTTSTTYDPSITAITVSTVDNSAVLVGWTGTYATVNLMYNKTGSFHTAATYSLKTGLTGNSNTVIGLDSSTNYYFMVRPYSNTGYVGTDSSMANIATYHTPTISKFMGYVYDSSSVILSWAGLYSSVNIYWDVSNAIVQTSGTVLGITGNTTTISGLYSTGDYNFRITPLENGIHGTTSVITIAKSNYNPVINNVSANSTGITSIMVEWVGNYTSVSIQYNDSGVFTNAYTTISGIKSSFYTVTGLSSSTTYYFRVLPYYDTTMGPYSSTVSAATSKPPRSYKVPALAGYVNNGLTHNYSTINGAAVSSSGKYIMVITYINEGVLLSRDYGITWTRMPLPFYTNYSGAPPNTNFCISPSGKYLLYAMFVNSTSSDHPVFNTYKVNSMNFYYSTDYGNTWGEFPYKSIYTYTITHYNIEFDTYFNSRMKLKIHDSGECLIGMTNFNGPCYLFYTADYGTNINILSTTPMGYHTGGVFFDCNETMTKLVCTDSSYNLFSMTAPFSTSAKTLVAGGSLAYHSSNYIVMSGDGSTLIVVNKVYTYSNSTSSWSLLRTVTNVPADFYTTQINYDASRIVFKSGSSIYVTYDKFLTYSHYSTPSSFILPLLRSPSKNDSMFVISGKPSVVTIDNFSTTTPIYTASYVGGTNITCSSDYKYIYCIFQGSIMYSGDYGETFTIITNSSLTSIAPTSNYDYNMIKCTADGEILYFATRNRTTDRGTIFKSTNRGITWSLMTTNFWYGNFVDCDPTGTLVLTNFSISYNGGVNWSGSPSYPNLLNGPFSLVDHQFLPNTSDTISYVRLDADYGIGKTVYNTTTNTVVNTVFNSVKVPGHASCCSSDIKYIYTIPGTYNGTSNIYKSSNYGNSYTLILSEITTSLNDRFSQKNIKCSDDGATVIYTYAMTYFAPYGNWAGISKDYGVTFNRKLLLGGYNDPNNSNMSSFLTLSRDGDSYTFWNNALIVNSPNFGASTSSYINAYVLDTSSNTTTINWDPSYSKVDINRNTTNLFDINDTTLLGITSTTSQIISGLSPNTKYYFRITPYISGVASTKQYTNITTLATATSLTAPTSDTSSVGLVWDGSFTTMTVFYNTTGTFATIDASLSGITTKTRTISGLTANTLYYFRLTPVSSAAADGIMSSIVSKYTTPSITAKSTSISGLTTISVSITGLYAYYTLKWNTTGVFDVSDSSATNITTSSYFVADLNIETTYYFKATPVGTSGIVGTTTDVFQATTPYIPTITDVSCYTVTNSSVIVSWDGSFNNVDIYWDLSGTFDTLVGSKTAVSGNSNTITGLSGSTQYYFKVVPKYDTFAGTAGSIVNTTAYYNPVLSTLTSTPASTSQINLVWDGSFTGVLVKYNTTNVFDTSGAVFSTLTFTTETAYSLTGLSPATVYYFRAVPQGTTGFSSTTVYNTNSTTDYLPILADISAVAIDTSSVTVTIAGLYENATIDYNDSGNYANSYNTVSTTTANTVINGLIEKKLYYFRVNPVGLRGLSGSYTSTKSVKTMYLPTLSYVVYLTLSKSEISLDYDGSFTSVSIVYDTSSSFAVFPTTVTGITTSTYILSGLQNDTKYYLKMLPYVLSVSGEYSAVSTATTNKAASADYEKYKVFDVNFNKSNLVGGVAKEIVSGNLSGKFGLGRVTADKRLYVNYTSSYNGGYVLTRNVTTYTNFITYSLWVNVFGYYPDAGNNAIIHFEQPWNDINSAKNMDLNLSSTGVISYSEYYGAIGGGRYTYNSNGVVPLNSWTHVALCIDIANAIIYFYVNGVYYPMVISNTSLYNYAKSCRVNEMVGANISSVIVGMGGNFYIDNVKIYKTTAAIDLAGINALMSDGAVYSSLSSTPVLYYPFDGDYNDYSSGSAISNATIYSADLYNQASISTNSICGTGSLSLNRLYTQYIKLSSFSINTSGLTVCGWVNTAQSDNNSSLFQLGNGSRMIYMCMVSGFLTLTVKNDSGTSIATMTTNITPSMLFTGTWFHYAITIGYAGTSGAASKYTLYINGNYYNSITTAYPVQGLYNTNYIGFNSSSNVYMTLLCDNFNVYAYPLTSGAVTALYSLRPTKKDSVNNKLVYYYKFIAKDISGNTGLKNYGVTNGYDGSTLSLSAAYSTVKKFNVVGRGSLRCNNGSYMILQNYKAFTMDGLTYSFWIKIDAKSIGSGFVTPISLFGGNINMSINTTTGYLQTEPVINIYQNQQITFSSASPAVPIGKTHNFTTWTHMCYVFYQNYAVLYINNVPYKKAYSWAGCEANAWGTASYIGGTVSTHFKGYMDDIRIYNTTLSHFEVTALYTYNGITEPNNNTLDITTKPVITSVVVTPNTSSSSLQLTWDGSFSTVNIYWNKTNSASVFEGNSIGLINKTISLTGLIVNTIYYFTLVPVSKTGVKGTSFLTNFTTTTPVSVSSFSLGTITGNSVEFMYGGTYTNVIIKYGTTPGSTTYIKTIMGSSTTTGTVTGLSALTTYYFNIYPLNKENMEGTKYITELSGTTEAFAFATFPTTSFWYRSNTIDISSTKLYNYSNNTHDATLINGVSIDTTDIKEGTGSLSLVAANSRYVALPSFTTTIPGVGGGMAFACWFKSNGTGEWGRIFDFGSGPSWVLVGMRINNFGIHVEGDQTEGITGINYNNNTWYHFVWNLTYTGSNKCTWTVYIDNSLIYTSANRNYPSAVSRTTNYLGKSNYNSDPYYNGKIDNFIMFNSPLTAEQISNLYNGDNDAFSVITSFSKGVVNDTNISFTYGGNYANVIIKYGSTPGSTTYSKLIMGSSTTTGTVTGLTASAPYYFNIYPINSAGVEGTVFETELNMNIIVAVSSFALGSVTSSSVAFTYAGTYSSVRIYYGTISGATVSGGIYITSTGASTTTATVTGLTASTVYYFTVVPVSSTGVSGTAFATQLTTTTISAVAGATISSFSLGSVTTSSISFSYTGTYSSVRIYYSTSTGTAISGGVYITSTGSSTTTATLTGLVATGPTYYFKIVPINDLGNSGTAFATELNARTLAEVTSFALGSVTSSSATFTYSGLYSSVWIYYGTVSGATVSGGVYLSSSGSTTTTATVTGLIADKIYYFTVVPFSNLNVRGNVFATELTANTSATVSSFALGSVTSSSVAFTYSGSYSSVLIYYGTVSGATVSGGVYLSSSGSTTTTATVTSLIANKTYYFTVVPFNNLGVRGNVFATELTASPTATVSSFALGSITSSSVEFTYAGTYSSVRIYYGTVSGATVSGGVYITSTGSTTTTATVTGLTADKTYYFTVVPINNTNVNGTTFATQLTASPTATVSSFALGSVTSSSVALTYAGTYSSVRIYYGTVSGNTVSGGVYITSTGASTTAATITSLTSSTIYYFTVVPVSSTGVSGTAFATELTTTTSAAAASATISAFSLENVTSSSVALTYAGSYSSVKIYYGIVSGATVSGGVYITSTGASTTTATITGLTVNKNYYFTVVPINIENVSGTVFATELIANPAATITSFVLNGKTDTSFGFTYAGVYSKMNIDYGTVSGTYPNTVVGGTTSATLTGLTPNTRYYYKGKPENSSGIKNLSAMTETSALTWGGYTSFDVFSVTSTSITFRFSGVYWLARIFYGNDINVNKNTYSYTDADLAISTDGTIMRNYTYSTLITANTTYYFAPHPYNSEGATGTMFGTLLSATTFGTITSFALGAVSATSVSFTFAGIYSSVLIYYGIVSGATVSGGVYITATGSTATVTDLTADKTYYFTVVPVNKVGVSGTTFATQLTATPTAVVSSFALGSVTSSSVAFTYAGSYSSVRIYYGTVSGSTVSGGVYITSAGASTTTATVTGLTGDKTYYFTVVPINNTNVSGTAFATQLTASPTAAVSAFALGSITSSSVALTYAGTYSSVRIYYGDVSGATVSGGVYITSAGASTTTATVTGLTVDKTYYFTVVPINSTNVSGTAFATELTANTIATVSSFVLGSVTSSSVAFTYAGSYSNVRIYYSDISGATVSGGVYITSTGSSTTTTTVTGLTANMVYYFSICTVDASGIQGTAFATVLSTRTKGEITTFTRSGLTDSTATFAFDGSYQSVMVYGGTSSPVTLANKTLSSNTGVFAALAPNTLYYFAIYWVTADASGAYGTQLSTRTSGKITSFTLSSFTNSQAIFAYDGSYSSVIVKYGVASLSSSLTVTGSSTKSATVSGLAANAAYNFDIYWVTAETSGSYGTQLSVRTPGRVNFFTLSSTTASTATFAFDGSYNSATICGGLSSDLVTVSNRTFNSSTGVFSGLSANTGYYFKILFETVDASGAGPQLYVTTKPIISSFTLGSVTSSSVAFSYAGTYSSVRIYYGTVSGATVSGGVYITSSGSSTTIATVTDLTASTVYYFTIIPVNLHNVVEGGTDFATQLSTTTTTAITLTPFENLLASKAPWGRYSAAFCSGTTLTDLTGNGRHATITGSYTTSFEGGNGSAAMIPCLTGSTAGIKVLWPAGSIPATNFTICEISRYIGSSAGTNGNNRIYGSNTTTAPDIIIGHWNNVRGYTSWGTAKTSNTTKGTLTNWLRTCVKSGGTIPNNILLDGVASGTATIANTTARNLSINYIEPGSWSITHLIIWNQVLTDSEMAIVSNAFDTYLSTGIMQEATDMSTIITYFNMGNITSSSISLLYNGNYDSVKIYYGTVSGATISGGVYITSTGASTTTATITGLTASTVYYFTVVPVSVAGVNGVIFGTQLTANSTATISSFTLGSITSSSVVLNYTGTYSSINIYYGPTLDNMTLTKAVAGSGTVTTTMSGLTINTMYYFSIYPVNVTGIQGAMFGTVRSTATIGAAITSFTVGTVTTDSAEFTYGGTYTDVIIYYGLTSGSTTFSQTLTGSSTTTATVSGLTSNTLYYFKIHAINVAGVQGAVFATSRSTTTLATISSFVFNGTNTGTTVGFNYSGTYTKVKIYYGGSLTTMTSSLVVNGSTVTSATVSGLTANTIYFFKITPFNSAIIEGLAYENVINTTTGAIITSFDLSATTTDIITLTYGGTYTGVNIYSGNSLGNMTYTKTVIGPGTTNTTTTMDSLIANTKYYFSIYPVNEAGIQGTVFANTVENYPIVNYSIAGTAMSSSYSENLGGYKVLMIYSTANSTASTTLTLTSSFNTTPAIINYFVIGGGGNGGNGTATNLTAPNLKGGNGGNGGVITIGSFENTGTVTYNISTGGRAAATSMSADGGISSAGGQNGVSSATSGQTAQIGAALGGRGAYKDAGDGGNGVAFPPNNIKYGGAGGGGLGSQTGKGLGGANGGGSGNIYLATGNGSTNYGSGGGGGGSGQAGGAGFKGAILLYWI